jgi:ferredoxin-NADP reductase
MIYSNKKPKDIIYHVELQMMERMNPNLKVVYTLTRLQDKLKFSWPGLTGRISAEMIKAEVLEWQQEGKQLSSYSCGPVPMLNTVEKCLLEIGWDKEKIHYEKFW